MAVNSSTPATMKLYGINVCLDTTWQEVYMGFYFHIGQNDEMPHEDLPDYRKD